MISCPPTLHVHEPPPTGGRCGFPSGRTRSGICGRESAAAYVGRDGIAWRCAAHDREVSRAEAKRQGFRRFPVGGQA